MKISKLFHSISLVLIFLGFNLMNEGKCNLPVESFKYITLEHGQPDSLDPLDADKSVNIRTARLLYLTPIEVSEHDELSSTVLESFDYNEKNQTIILNVKDNIKFANDQTITPDDVAFAITRMAFFRPQFPTIRYIDGIDDWIKSNTPLQSYPKGISIVGKTISIKLSRHIPHPLFRFCLEIFSIIPKDCVDLKTGKIKCQKIPESGFYKFDKIEENKWFFSLRDNLKSLTNKKLPETIIFQYSHKEKITNFIKAIDSRTVLASSERIHSTEELKIIREQFNIKNLASAWFALFLINPNIPPFNTRECRRFFVDQFNKNYATLFGDQLRLETSIFTKLVPGYLSSESLSAKSKENIDQKKYSKCLDDLKNEKIVYGRYTDNAQSLFFDTLKLTLSNLGIWDTVEIPVKSKEEMDYLFLNNKINFAPGFTGFWPLDPVGDMQMLFTPDLHKTLLFVSRDVTLQTLLKEIDEVKNSEEKIKKLILINQYMHDHAIFNVYTHFRRFFATSKDNSLQDIPMSITSPTLWQLFNQNHKNVK